MVKDDGGILSFVDTRRFGRWREGEFEISRSPDPVDDYSDFVANVKKSFANKIFTTTPICELLLNQKYFNGIGNYLRAEILGRLEINPFMPAREALIGAFPPRKLPIKDEKVRPVRKEEHPSSLESNGTAEIGCSEKSKDTDIKEDWNCEENALLQSCRSVCQEVIDFQSLPGRRSRFSNWLQFYSQEGRAFQKDKNGRMIWFSQKFATSNSKVLSRKKKLGCDAEPKKKTPLKRSRSDSNLARASTKRREVREESDEDSTQESFQDSDLEEIAVSVDRPRTRASRESNLRHHQNQSAANEEEDKHDEDEDDNIAAMAHSRRSPRGPSLRRSLRKGTKRRETM